MDDLALEALGARKVRGIASVIIVVAAAHKQKIAGEMRDLAVGALLDLYRPQRIL